MNKLNQSYINALIKRYEYEILEAEAGLELYLSNVNLSAIGEHSDLLHEQNIFVEKLTNAKDKLETFKDFLNSRK